MCKLRINCSAKEKESIMLGEDGEGYDCVGQPVVNESPPAESYSIR